jgi:hypothetical protein
MGPPRARLLRSVESALNGRVNEPGTFAAGGQVSARSSCSPERSHSLPSVGTAAIAINGHSMIDHPCGCFTPKTGYSLVGGNKFPMKARFRPARTVTSDPEPASGEVLPSRRSGCSGWQLLLSRM